ncbi:hypothetical protein HKX48_000137 [Thoreauomyces humboldtii]|nr:hypothetical protein HKX48_000137 [Thoreauomyces humboldtii]
MSPTCQFPAPKPVSSPARQNNPLYIKNCSTTYPDLKCHYVAHTSIDLIEERISATKHADQYLGLLYAMEELAVFGYITNTRVKFIIVTSLVSDVSIKDQDMKNMFRRIHNAYVTLVSCPFHDPDGKQPITSPAFEKAMAEVTTI